MQVIKETIGTTTILIETVSEDLEIVGEPRTGRATQTTSIEVQATYAKLKPAIRGIAQDIETELEHICATTRPKQVEMECPHVPLGPGRAGLDSERQGRARPQGDNGCTIASAKESQWTQPARI